MFNLFSFRKIYITVYNYLMEHGYLIKYSFDMQNWEQYPMDRFWPGDMLMSKAQNIHWL